MATLRQAIRAIRQCFPEHVRLLGMSHHDKGRGHTGKLGEDGRDEDGRKSWWFEFEYREDDGTHIEFGDGYVHGDGTVEGLYGTYWDLQDHHLLNGTYAIHYHHPGAVPGAAWVARMGGA